MVAQRQTNDSPAIEPTLRFTHQSKSQQTYTLGLHEQSGGTRQLVQQLIELYRSLSTGEFATFDELENKFHPLLVRLFISFFASSLNDQGAQMLFTTHDATMLDNAFLRRDQYWFTEKDQYGRSALGALAEFRARKGESLMQSYLSGSYGAIPYLEPFAKLITEEGRIK